MDVAAHPLLADRYEIGPLLGRGGMAEVHRAHDRFLQRTVAVKCFDGAQRARFTAEARAAASVAHPNVVTVFDVGVDDGVPFIVMEYLTGGTLADHIQRSPLSTMEALDIVRAVLAALAVAHDGGVLHRDLKPSNVLFTEDGIVKLGDFGIARADAALDLTDPGMVLGTPTYLAPERLAGEPATVRSDLYSVGVMLREALTGSPADLGAVPAVVAPIVARATAYRPEDRFASAREFGHALDLRVDRTQVIPIVPAVKPARRLRGVRATMFGAIAVFALVVGATFAFHGASQAHSTHAPATNTGVEQKFDKLQNAVGK